MSTPQLTPDQAKFILHTALPTLKSEHQTTRRVIEAIPLEKGDYRPDAISKTALELAWHIVAAEKRFLSGIPAGAFDFTPIHRPESIKNSADIAAWFEETFAANLKKIEALDGETLAKLIDFRGMFQLPAAAFLQSRAEPHHPPSRTAFHVLAAHGRQSAVDLRRKLRHDASPAGKESKAS